MTRHTHAFLATYGLFIRRICQAAKCVQLVELPPFFLLEKGPKFMLQCYGKGTDARWTYICA